VFDFNSKSALEAYLETVPPKVKTAIKNHQVLVGMNQEMVIYAKGRAPKKMRERDGDTQYEEWIYGDPPQDVEFVRFVGDEVVRDEIMTVSGEKAVKTEKEVDIKKEEPTEAKASERPANAPSLRRPGEAAPDLTPAGSPANTRPAAPPSGPTGPGDPNPTDAPSGTPGSPAPNGAPGPGNPPN